MNILKKSFKAITFWGIITAVVILFSLAGCQTKPKQSVITKSSHTFSMDSVNFLLDGKPFEDRKSTRLNSSYIPLPRMPSSA